MGHGLFAWDVGDGAFHWGGGGGVAFLGDAAGLVGLVSGFACFAHGVGHHDWVLGVGDGGVEEDGVGAEFHCDGDIACAAHSRIDDDGVVWVVLFEEVEAEDDVVVVEDALSGSDRGAGGHDGGGAGFFDSEGGDGVVAGIAKDIESVGGEFFDSFDGAYGVWEEGLFVSKDFELDPTCAGVAELFEEVATEAGDADGVLGAEASCGVGEDGVAIEVDVFEEGFALVVEESLATDGDGDDVGSRGVEGLGHGFHGRVFTGPDEEAGVEGFACN